MHLSDDQLMDALEQIREDARCEADRVFTIERRLYSPVPLTGPWLNSQVWFVCRKL